MTLFCEKSDKPIASEMIRQGFTPDSADILQWTSHDEREHEIDAALAVGVGAFSLVCACAVLSATGATLTLLAPLGALAFAGVTAWNAKIAKQDREFEAEFLHDHPDVLTQLTAHGDKAATLYDLAFKAWREGDAGRVAKVLSGAPVTGLLPPVTDAPELANSLEFPPTPTNSCQTLNSELANTPTQPNSCQTPDDTPIAGPTAIYNQSVTARSIGNLNLGGTEDPAPANSNDIPVLDIAAKIRGHECSVMVFAAPGTGKTVLLRQVLKGLPGEASVMVIDPKNSLWPEGVTVHPAHTPERAADCVQVLEKLYGFLQRRIESRHGQSAPYDEMVLVIDELLGWLEDLKDWDAMKAGDKEAEKLHPRAMALLKQLLTKGREDRIRVIAISHSPLVRDIGLSTSMLRTLAMVSLGREQSSNLLMESVPYVVPTTSRQRAVTAQLDAAIAQANDQTIALWCEGGGQVCYLPDYPTQQRGMKLVPAIGRLDQRSDRQRLEAALMAIPQTDHEAIPSKEDLSPIAAEILRLLRENPDGMKPRDISRLGRNPVRGMGVDLIREELDRLIGSGTVFESDGTYFCS